VWDFILKCKYATLRGPRMPFLDRAESHICILI